MSGFIGRVSTNLVKKEILSAVKILQFKDDDSTGVMICTNQDCHKFRVAGQLDELLPKIEESIDGHLGIASTRWSTHPRQVKENVYPINSQKGTVELIVHGLADNIVPLKRKLKAKGIVFKSDSAVEVLANFLEMHLESGLTPQQALVELTKTVEGNYSLIAVIKDQLDAIYYSKRRDPLIIADTGDGFALTSDFSAISNIAKSYYYPDDVEVGYVTANEVQAFDLKLKRKKVVFTETTVEEEDLTLGNYSHYMLKEMEEAPRVIRRLISNYFDGTNYRFVPSLIQRIKNAENIIFIAAGTSYNAALVGQRYFRAINKNVDVFIASEWNYYPYRTGKDPLYILISQSGETSDILKCLKIIESYGGDVLALTNAEVSTLYSRSDYKLLLHAGTEVSVASTKAYIAQITMLSLLTAAIIEKTTTVAALEAVIESLEDIIARRQEIEKLAVNLIGARDAFFLGRGFDYDLAIEAQLKLKETTYIHSEAYAGGEILHGPVAVIEDTTPLVLFVSDTNTSEAMRTVSEELKHRSKIVIICSLGPLARPGDSFVVNKPVKGYHSPMVFGLFSQYLAYYTAVGLGRDVDRPRSLSKAVKDNSNGD